VKQKGRKRKEKVEKEKDLDSIAYYLRPQKLDTLKSISFI